MIIIQHPGRSVRRLLSDLKLDGVLGLKAGAVRFSILSPPCLLYLPESKQPVRIACRTTSATIVVRFIWALPSRIEVRKKR